MNRPNSVLIVARFPSTRVCRPVRSSAAGAARVGGGRAGPSLSPSPGGEARAGSGDHVQRDHVVGGPAVPQRPRAAGVVADRAADGGPGVGRRVRAEAQAVRCGRGADVVEHGPRLDQRGLLLGVDVEHVVEVPRQVKHEPRRQGVARDRGTAAAADDRRVQLAADGQGGDDLVGAARERDDLGDDPVVGGVGRVLRPPPGRSLNLGQPGRAEPGGQLLGVDGLPWCDCRPRGHHSRKPSTAVGRQAAASGWSRPAGDLRAARFLLLSRPGRDNRP